MKYYGNEITEHKMSETYVQHYMKNEKCMHNIIW
jgi:hypothetical protein